jgi:hypothetical protein
MASSAPLPSGPPDGAPPGDGSYGGGWGGRRGGGWRRNLTPEERAALHRARLIRVAGLVIGFVGLLLLFSWLFYRFTSAPGTYGPGGVDYLPLGLLALGLIIVGFVLRWTGRGLVYRERQKIRSMNAGPDAGGGSGAGAWAGGPGQGRRGRRICPQCGRPVGPRAAFCPSCGARMEPAGTSTSPPFAPPTS